MPPGAQVVSPSPPPPLALFAGVKGSRQVQERGVAEARITLDDLHKRMQQSEGNASSIERQLNDVRSHLKTLREQVTLDETSVQSIDLDSLAACLNNSMHEAQQVMIDQPPQPQQAAVTNHDNEHAPDNDRDRDEVQLVLEGVDVQFSRLKRKVDEVQAELQISWMSLTTLQLQLQAKRGSGATVLAEQLDTKSRALEQLSGSYERLRHAFIDKEEELRYERQLATNTLKALTVTHRDMDLKIESIHREFERLKALALQLKDWCSATHKAADEQCAQLKHLRTDLASIASRLLHILVDTTTTSRGDTISANANVNANASAAYDGLWNYPDPEPCTATAPPASTNMFQEMSNRLELLVQELRSGKVEHDKRNAESTCSPPAVPGIDDAAGCNRDVMAEAGESTALECSGGAANSAKCPNVGKRKLSEAFTTGSQQQQQIEDREKAFLSQKKAFLSGLRESFQRVRQREVACASLDRRLLKARLLLEQAQRGCISSDSVSMKSKRQMEQACKELLYVQREIDSIKAVSMLEHQELSMKLDGQGALSSDLVVCLSPSSTLGVGAGGTSAHHCLHHQKGGELGRTREELVRQVELNTKLKQQIAKLCLQAERAEGMVAVERLEVDKLREQVQGISERLKQEARGLNESHTAALRARDSTIEQLRHQVDRDETRKLLNAALDKNEELSAERDALVAKLGGQDLDLLKLRNENVCLVVEKIAFEGSARALQEKMASLMTKLCETKQHWKRFVVYCQTF